MSSHASTLCAHAGALQCDSTQTGNPAEGAPGHMRPASAQNRRRSSMAFLAPLRFIQYMYLPGILLAFAPLLAESTDESWNRYARAVRVCVTVR